MKLNLCTLIKKKILFLVSALFILWIGISILRLMHNLTRVVGEENRWIYYTENQKREELYGDIFNITQYLNVNFPEAKSYLIISKDGKPYFIARYILYPKLVHWDVIENHILDKKNNYSLIINFHPEDNATKYNTHFFSTISKNRKVSKIEKQGKVIAIIYI